MKFSSAAINAAFVMTEGSSIDSGSLLTAFSFMNAASASICAWSTLARDARSAFSAMNGSFASIYEGSVTTLFS